MTAGQNYIKDNHITELSYEDAIEQSIKEFETMDIINFDTLYESNGCYLDNPVYPCNANLYDEFVNEYGFCEDEFATFCVSHMKK